MIRVGRRYHFSASHRLFNPALSEARNREIYGKCANPFGHGHDYEMEILVSGEIDAVTGRAVNLATLDALVEQEILGAFRYRNLNQQIEVFRRVVPTTENLTAEVDRRLRSVWREHFEMRDGPVLEKVRIWETDRNICEMGYTSDE